MIINFDNPWGIFWVGFFGCVALGILAGIIKEAIQARGLHHLEKLVDALSPEEKAEIVDGVKSNLTKVIENANKED